MSFSKPTYRSPTGTTSQKFQWWANSCYYSHETICGCNDFAYHLLGTVSGLSRHDIRKALDDFVKSKQQCLSTHTDAGEGLEGTAGTGPDEFPEGGLLDTIEPDELERLFEEPLANVDIESAG